MYLDKILRWEGLKHGDEKAQNVFIAGILALEQEVLVVEDDLTVHVLYQDPESLRATVDLIVPLKVRSDGQLNLKSAPEGKNKSVIIYRLE